jgi:pimeloyl-ACP methyl ester carboxylesterase
VLRESLESCFRTFGGHRLRFLCHGNGSAQRTAVFLHDGLGAIESWKSIPRRLSTEYSVRTVVYDRWGYGRSEDRVLFGAGFMEAEVPTLMEIIDSTEMGSVDLVGHSDGATIALLAAAWHPSKIRSVVSIAAHTFVEAETTKSIEGLRAQSNRGRAPSWLSGLHGTRGEPLLEAWAEVWLGESHAKWDVSAELPRVKCPVLAIQGNDDGFGSDEQLAVLGEFLPDSEIWRVRGGHAPHHELGAAFIRGVGDFWLRT